MTVDEIREQMDLPPLENGEGKVILNSVFVQFKQMAMQEAQGGGDMGGGMPGEGDQPPDEAESEEGGDETDQMVDEAMKGLEKAVRII